MRRGCLSLGALFLASAGALSACDDATPVSRGFSSTQLLALRDSTFEFWFAKGDRVVYRTGRDEFGNGDPTFWSVDLGTGQVQNLGGTMPAVTDPPPPARYQCQSDGGDGPGAGSTFTIMDTQTGQLTAIERVYTTEPACPTDDDPTLQLWRIEPDQTLTLWTGPYTYLVQVPLPIAVRELLARLPAGWMVGARSSAPPNGLGIYSFQDQDPTTVTEVIPAAMGSAAWAPGATPTGSSLASSSLVGSTFLLPAGTGRYCYERMMTDGSVVMFAGLQPTDPRELALFPEDNGVDVVSVQPYSYRYDGIWWFSDAWTSPEGSPTTVKFRLWRPTSGLFTECDWPGGDLHPLAYADPADENVILLEQQAGAMNGDNSPFTLVVPGATDGNRCKLMAPTGVGFADFSPDGTALAWLVEPPDGKATLWTAARDGSAPRAIGTDYIDGFNHPSTRAPHFVGDSQLEMTLDGDLVWVDVHDDPVRTHTITLKVFGADVDLGRWLVSGHDHSEQDGNGRLALINRDSGETHEISPGVSQYMSPDVPSYGTTPGVFKDDGAPVRIVYLVRGRNPSPQDGLWVATITAQDRK